MSLRLALGLALLAAATHAEVPSQIVFHGTVEDPPGTPLTGVEHFRFRLYDAESGGTLLGEETETTTLDARGGYSIRIGDFTSLDPEDFLQPLWVEITRDPFGTPVTLAPRQPLRAAPQALRAHWGEGVLPGQIFVERPTGVASSIAGTALKDLLATLSPSTPLVLQLPPGDFQSTTGDFLVPANVHLVGSGRGQTRLILPTTPLVGEVVLNAGSQLRSLTVVDDGPSAVELASGGDALGVEIQDVRIELENSSSDLLVGITADQDVGLLVRDVEILMSSSTGQLRAMNLTDGGSFFNEAFVLEDVWVRGTTGNSLLACLGLNLSLSGSPVIASNVNVEVGGPGTGTCRAASLGGSSEYTFHRGRLRAQGSGTNTALGATGSAVVRLLGVQLEGSVTGDTGTATPPTVCGDHLYDENFQDSSSGVSSPCP